MTEPAPTATDAARRTSPVIAVLGRIPATLVLLLVLIAVGVIGQGLWSATSAKPWFESIAYGLPALIEFKLWTPFTGTFFVMEPWIYIPTVIGFVWVGLLEWQRGSRMMLAYFVGGQIVAVLSAALFLFFASMLPWPWADQLALVRDVGPSGGTMACFAACVSALPAPWRQRGWVIVFGYAAISVLFLGSLADLEHAFAIVFVLAVDRSFRIQRTTIREQRQLVLAAYLALGAIQIITLLIPTNGPFGPTQPLDGPWVDVLTDTVVILLISRGLHRGRRWAWVLTLIWSALNVLTAALYFVLAGVDGVELDLAYGDVSVSIASSALWFAMLVLLLATRRAFGARKPKALARAAKGGPAAPTAADARSLIQAQGGGTLSWMATWDGLEYYRTRTGLVPFQTHAGVAVVLADPLGEPAGIADSVHEFTAAAVQHSLIPCFFSAGQVTKDAIPEGWRSLIIADDTIVDLPGIAFTGKAWSNVRQALNRGEREGIEFRLTTLSAEPWGIRQQLKAISESWVGDKGLPEMKFTLGTLHEAEDPEVRLALAISPLGDVEGFLSWLPVYGAEGQPRGWTLDLMRRRDDGFGAVMEFLIGSSAKAFAEEGAQILSLSGAPLAHQPTEEEGRIARLLGQLSSSLEPVYGFSSLHRFKEKFNPRYEPIYLLYRDEGDLPAIGAALTRAFLPDATLRQFAAAGIDILRGD